jgi:uncharacterized protein YndB with AHSA1/START domain
MLRRILIKSGLASLGGLVLHRLFANPLHAQPLAHPVTSGVPNTIRKTKVVSGSVESVFQFFTDPENAAKYIPNCTAVRNTRPVAVGSTWEYDYGMAGVTFTGTSRCTQLEANKTFGLRSEGGFPSDWLYTFESAGPNLTRVSVTVTYDPPERLLAKIARKNLLKMHDVGAEQGLENAKELIENK